jgi:(p)ppGpp synthase/HD superfamily hydrolase
MRSLWNKEVVYKTVIYAMKVHKHLSMKGQSEIPFSGHFVNVMLNALNFIDGEDVDRTLIIQLALLHDSIEDAGLSYNELVREFGQTVADGVMALSRDENIPYEKQIPDCVERIKKLSNEVAIVKMADRLFNIRQRAESWTKQKQDRYKVEAQFICDELGYCSENLKKALQEAIEKY